MRYLHCICVCLMTVGLLCHASAEEPLPIVDWLVVDAASPAGFGVPFLLEGKLILGTEAGLVRAFEAVTGQEAWRHTHGARITGTPESDGEQIYFPSDRGVFALTRDGNRQPWLHPFKDGVGCITVSPRLKLVFVGCYDGFVRALDSTTGEQRWQTNIMADAPPDPPEFDGRRARFQEIKARASAAVYDENSVFFSIFDQCRVVGCDARTGEMQFTYQTKGWVSSEPTITDETVLVGSQDKHVYNIDRATGEMRWKFATKGRADDPIAIKGDDLFFGSSDGNIHCVNRTTGEQRWKYETEPDYTGRRFISGKPLVTDPLVYVNTCEGQVYALKRNSGALVWKLRADEPSQVGGSPVANDRRLFVITRPDWDNRGRNALVAIDLKPTE